MKPSQMAALVRRAMGQSSKDNVAFLAAGLAFNVMLAMSPLLIVLLAIASPFLAPGRAEDRLLAAVNSTVGPSAAQLIHDVIASANRSGAGPVASIVGLLLTLIVASNVIQQMKFVLNSIWRVPSGIMSMRSVVFGRFRSLLVLGTLAVIMLLWLALDASVALLGRLLQGASLGPLPIWSAVTFVASVVINSVLFGFFYRYIPDTPIQWRDVVFGSILAAVLFTLGKALLGGYFALSGIIRAYGAAGSLVAMLLWLYYSGQIFLLGAEVTVKYAHTYGSRVNSPMPHLALRL
jgi:membrane protein